MCTETYHTYKWPRKNWKWIEMPSGYWVGWKGYFSATQEAKTYTCHLNHTNSWITMLYTILLFVPSIPRSGSGPYLLTVSMHSNKSKEK